MSEKITIDQSQDNHKEHNYDYDELRAGSSHLCIFEMVNENKKVLEIGAGSGIIGFYLSKLKNCDVTAVELEPSVKLKSRIDKVYACDLNQQDWVDLFENNEKFDTIIAADVLEHLYDPLAVIYSMRNLLKPGGEIIISLPNVGHASVIASLINHDFEYRREGLLDKTHIRFFSLENICSLHNEAGLAIAEARFILKRPEDTELASQWKLLTYDLKKAISRNKTSLVYQVITKAVVIENGNPVSIELSKLTVDLSFRNYISPMNARVRISLAEFLCSISRAFKRIANTKGFLAAPAERLNRMGDRLYRDTMERCDHTGLDS